MWERHRKLIVSLLLAAVIIAAFAQLKNADYINFDDNEYVTENRMVLQGIAAKGIIWAFTTYHASNWHPLTWLSHMADCQLYGPTPSGQHITNVILHIINTLLLFLFFNRVTQAFWASAMLAALFALHPLHVESVAWVSERKDVLSTFFWMTTLWAYCWYVEKPGLDRYLLVLLSFALGLMAKPMLVTLPLVLLLLDYWPLARVQGRLATVTVPAKTGLSPDTGKPLGALVLEKAPLLALAAVSSFITMQAQKQAFLSLEVAPLTVRSANALLSYGLYIGKMIWPAHLAIFYPYALDSLAGWGVIAASLALVSASILVILKGRKYPYLPVGWFWYLVTLVPVIGLVQVGGQAMADRYTYIPLIGLFLIIVWGARDLTAGWRRQKIFLVSSAVIALTLCACLTWRQAGYWRNSVALYEHALAVTGNNSLVLHNLGEAYLGAGRIDEAIVQFQTALKINPRYADAHHNLGICLGLRGQMDQAIAQLKEAVRLQPDSAKMHFNLGVALASQGDLDGALAQYQAALALDADDPLTLNNLADLLATAADPRFRDGPKAVQLAEKANRLRGRDPVLMDTLAAAYAEAGRFPEARETAQKARDLALALGRVAFAGQIDQRLLLYRQDRPYHAGPGSN